MAENRRKHGRPLSTKVTPLYTTAYDKQNIPMERGHLFEFVMSDAKSMLSLFTYLKSISVIQVVIKVSSSGLTVFAEPLYKTTIVVVQFLAEELGAFYYNGIDPYWFTVDYKTLEDIMITYNKPKINYEFMTICKSTKDNPDKLFINFDNKTKSNRKTITPTIMPMDPHPTYHEYEKSCDESYITKHYAVRIRMPGDQFKQVMQIVLKRENPALVIDQASVRFEGYFSNGTACYDSFSYVSELLQLEQPVILLPLSIKLEGLKKIETFIEPNKSGQIRFCVESSGQGVFLQFHYKIITINILIPEINKQLLIS